MSRSEPDWVFARHDKLAPSTAQERAGADSLHESVSRDKNASDRSATRSLGLEGAVAFVEILSSEIVRNVEGLFPTAIAKVAGRFQDLTPHFGRRLF
jgi:hypothetical protein